MGIGRDKCVNVSGWVLFLGFLYNVCINIIYMLNGKFKFYIGNYG